MKSKISFFLIVLILTGGCFPNRDLGESSLNRREIKLDRLEKEILEKGEVFSSSGALDTTGFLSLSNVEQQHEEISPYSKGPQQRIKIDNGINRGLSYTDPLGTTFNLRYIPVRIMNDSTIPVNIKIAFAKDYTYSMASDTESFKVFPLPQAWAQEGQGINDSMVGELPGLLEKPMTKLKLEPGEEGVIAIATLYPRPSKLSGVLPRELFIYKQREMFPNCDWNIKEEPSPNPKLKLIFGENCRVIPCGELEYEHP